MKIETKAKTVVSAPAKTLPATAKTTAAPKPAAKGTSTAPKAMPAAAKSEVPKHLKDAAKVTTTICGDIKKKVLNHKSATLPDITEVAGINKAEMMKLIELLDGMGAATYTTACELRDLHNKMR